MKLKWLFLVVLPHFGIAQPTLKAIESLCDSLARTGIEQKLLPAMGVVIIKGDSSFSKTYGLSNVEDKVPATDSTLFQLGSVGKLFTAIAVLQQVERGTLDLDKDVNEYLKDFKIENPYPTPVTLRRLLTHTAGFDEQTIGYLARTQAQAQPLGIHLKSFMPKLFQEPGKEINYSNYGYALAGHLVEIASGKDFQQYIRENIFFPLQMNTTTYFLSDDYENQKVYARGYRIRDDYQLVKSYPRHAVPAGSALSSVNDMRKLLEEFHHPSGKILRPESMNELFEHEFSNHELLMGYTMGMEEQFIRGHRGVAKGGAFTGFLSEFVIFPDLELAMFVSVNTQTDNFLEMFHKRMLKALLPDQGSPATAIKIDVAEFTGTYRSERYNHRTIEDLFGLYNGKFDLRRSEQGWLQSYHNGSNQDYKPVDSLIFQNTMLPNEFLVFEKDKQGRITRLYRNSNISGFYIPVSFSKVPAYDDPVFINEYYFVVLLFVFTFISIPIYRGWVLWKRRKFPDHRKGRLIPRFAFYSALIAMLALIGHFIGSVLYVARKQAEFTFGVPDYFKTVQALTWLLPVLAVALVIATFRIWKHAPTGLAFRIYYTLFAICCVIHVAFLYRWHFIGMNF